MVTERANVDILPTNIKSHTFHWHIYVWPWPVLNVTVVYNSTFNISQTVTDRANIARFKRLPDFNLTLPILNVNLAVGTVCCTIMYCAQTAGSWSTKFCTFVLTRYVCLHCILADYICRIVCMWVCSSVWMPHCWTARKRFEISLPLFPNHIRWWCSSWYWPTFEGHRFNWRPCG